MKVLASLLALTLAAAGSVSAQTTSGTATTDPVGYLTVNCPASSDTTISLPFARASEYVGNVSSVSGSTIILSGTPTWTANQWVYSGSGSKTYYALIGPNQTPLVGTISTTAGSQTITGVGTSFTTAVHANDVLVINGNGFYRVVSVDSDTSLTVFNPAQASNSGLNAAVSVASNNPREGCVYTITANDSSSITLNLNGDSISTLGAGTQILIAPYWTLSTLLPASAAGTAFTVTTNFRQPQTQILVPNYGGTGINLSAARGYFFYNNAWRQSGDSLSNDHSDDILIPDGYVILRNTGNASTVTIAGNVEKRKLTVPLAMSSGSQQDNPVAVARPVDFTLNSADFLANGAFAITTNFRQPQDQVLVFDNTSVGINKSAAKGYFYYNGAWRLSGDSLSVDHGNDVIPAGTGFIIRKASNTSNSTAFWQHTPTFN